MNVLRLCGEFYSRNNLRIGLSPHFYNLSLALQGRGISQTILAQNTDSENIEGIPVIKFSSKRPFSLLRTGDFAFKKISELNLDFDVLHYHNPAFFRLTAYKKQIRKPIVATIHASPSEQLKNISLKPRQLMETLFFYFATKASAKKLDALVCTSSGVREDLIQKFDLSPDKVYAISTAVDTSIFYPEKIEKDIDILFVGRISTVKNLSTLIKAVKLVAQNFPRIKVLLLGASEIDNDYNEISTLISSLSLSENITIAPFVHQDKLNEYYNRSKMFVLPSYAESTPKVVIEAMACGTPVIITDIKGNSDILSIKNSSLSFKPGDSEMLAEHISLLMADSGVSDKIGKNAACFVRNNLTWDKIAEKYVKLYNSL